MFRFLKLWKQIERITNEDEKIKLKIEFIKAVGTVGPILIAMIAIIANIFLQNFRAKIDFQLKAAEIIMNNPSANDGINKAIVMRELFPDRISSNFEETLKRLYQKKLIMKVSKLRFLGFLHTFRG